MKPSINGTTSDYVKLWQMFIGKPPTAYSGKSQLKTSVFFVFANEVSTCLRIFQVRRLRCLWADSLRQVNLGKSKNWWGCNEENAVNTYKNNQKHTKTIECLSMYFPAEWRIAFGGCWGAKTMVFPHLSRDEVLLEKECLNGTLCALAKVVFLQLCHFEADTVSTWNALVSGCSWMRG